MPIICRFFGIAIYMHWRDHAPPHFHAKYAGDEITVEIETGIVTGTMSNRAIGMIQEWRGRHHVELMDNWKLLEERKEINQIQPLE